MKLHARAVCFVLHDTPLIFDNDETSMNMFGIRCLFWRQRSPGLANGPGHTVERLAWK